MREEGVVRVNLSELIADKIRQDIIHARLAPGDKLPPHEELCTRWGVSRVTVREALNKLQAMGLVEIHQGRGTYIRQANQSFFKKHFEIHLILDKETVLSLLEARKIIETSLVELATARRTPDEISKLKDIMEKMRIAVEEDDSLEFAVIDFQFHKTIAEIAKNRFLYLMLEKIQYFMENQQRDMYAYSLAKGIVGHTKSYRDHLRIYSAMAKKDCQGATESMHKHITRIENLVISYYAQQK